jgi:hypothetical protein
VWAIGLSALLPLDWVWDGTANPYRSCLSHPTPAPSRLGAYSGRPTANAERLSHHYPSPAYLYGHLSQAIARPPRDLILSLLACMRWCQPKRVLEVRA